MSAAPSPSAHPKHLAFIATTTEPGGSRGIYVAHLDPATGAFTTPVLAAETRSPNYLALSADRTRLYALHDSAALSVGYRIAGEALVPFAPPAPHAVHPPSHLALDASGRLLVCSHYNDGTISTVAVSADGIPLAPPTSKLPHAGTGPHAKRQDKPHPHSAVFSPDNRFAYVCDLGADKIYCYHADPARAALTPATPPFVAAPSGSGPRHSVISSDGKFLHVVNELANTVDTYARDLDSGALTLASTHSTLPPDFSGETITAEIRLRADGRFLYASNRGHDSIAAFSRDSSTGQLTLLEIVSCRGKHPRNFSLTPDGAWLVVSNRDTNNLVVFRVDRSTGRLTFASETLLAKPMCVAFVS